MEETGSADTAEDRFGRRVRVERERLMWTQSDLAAQLREVGLSLHPSAIAKIELRDVERPRSIRLEEAQAIARVFHLSVDDMYETEQIRSARLLANSRNLAANLLELSLDYEQHIDELQSYLDGLPRDVVERGRATMLFPQQKRVAMSLNSGTISGLLVRLRHPSRNPDVLRRAAEQIARDEEHLQGVDEVESSKTGAQTNSEG